MTISGSYTADQALADRLDSVRRRVADAAVATGRDPSDVRILLATKTVSAPVIAEAVRAGFDLIGENRVQEVVAKAPELTELGVRPERHFIGRLQSNKIGALLPLVDCVQTVHAADLARRLASRADAAGRVLDVFVQVNVSGEETKSGAAPGGAVDLAAVVLDEPALRLRGLMTVGLFSADSAAVRAGYERLRELSDRVRDLPGGAAATELSMGMSGDFAVAIAAGATMVRIGSAAFGARLPAPR